MTGAYDLWIIDADGRNNRRLTNWPGHEAPRGWLPDGRILFSRETVQGLVNWYVMRPDGSRLRSIPMLRNVLAPIDWHP